MNSIKKALLLGDNYMYSIISGFTDISRGIKHVLGFFGHTNVNGFPLDWVFHLILAFLLMYLLKKFVSTKKSIAIVLFLIVFKEIIDIFGKSKIEYIVPPSIDTPKDIIAGLLGIYLYFRMPKRTKKNKTIPIQEKLL